jgi:hypothetical protein
MELDAIVFIGSVGTYTIMVLQGAEDPVPRLVRLVTIWYMSGAMLGVDWLAQCATQWVM